MSLAVVLEGMTLVALVLVMSGGRQKRESGWKVLSFLLVLTGIVECASMALIVSRFDASSGLKLTQCRCRPTFLIMTTVSSWVGVSTPLGSSAR